MAPPTGISFSDSASDSTDHGEDYGNTRPDNNQDEEEEDPSEHAGVESGGSTCMPTGTSSSLDASDSTDSQSYGKTQYLDEHQVDKHQAICSDAISATEGSKRKLNVSSSSYFHNLFFSSFRVPKPDIQKYVFFYGCKAMSCFRRNSAKLASFIMSMEDPESTIILTGTLLTDTEITAVLALAVLHSMYRDIHHHCLYPNRHPGLVMKCDDGLVRTFGSAEAGGMMACYCLEIAGYIGVGQGSNVQLLVIDIAMSKMIWLTTLATCLTLCWARAIFVWQREATSVALC